MLTTKNKLSWAAFAALLIAYCYYNALIPTTLFPGKSQSGLRPATPNIIETIIPHKSFIEVEKQFNEWGKVAPQLCRRGSLSGTTSKGLMISYLEVTNRLNKNPKSKILIMATIHGNELLATSVCMSYIANLLSKYNVVGNEDITRLLDTKDIYFIPITSPDSYAISREVDGSDPNRNFNGPGVSESHRPNNTIKAIQDFEQEYKFDAMMSLHTYSRLYMYPYGFSTQKCPDDNIYQNILGECARLSKYRLIRGVEMYNREIKGSEMDYFYSNNCLSCVCELGTHQKKPTLEDTKIEVDRTFAAFKYFLKNSEALKNKRYFMFTNVLEKIGIN